MYRESNIETSGQGGAAKLADAQWEAVQVEHHWCGRKSNGLEEWPLTSAKKRLICYGRGRLERGHVFWHFTCVQLVASSNAADNTLLFLPQHAASLSTFCQESVLLISGDPSIEASSVAKVAKFHSACINALIGYCIPASAFRTSIKNQMKWNKRLNRLSHLIYRRATWCGSLPAESGIP